MHNTDNTPALLHLLHEAEGCSTRWVDAAQLPPSQLLLGAAASALKASQLAVQHTHSPVRVLSLLLAAAHCSYLGVHKLRGDGGQSMGASWHTIKHKPAIRVCKGAQLVAAAGEQQQLYGAAPLQRDGLESVLCKFRHANVRLLMQGSCVLQQQVDVPLVETFPLTCAACAEGAHSKEHNTNNKHGAPNRIFTVP